MNKKVDHSEPISFRRTGFYRFWAFILGQTKIKSVSFYENHLSISQPYGHISIQYENINLVRLGGIGFKKFIIKADAQNLVVRGLSKRDARALLSLFENSDSNSWLRKFKPLRNEIESLTDWIDDVWNRKFYQRHSVYNARIKKVSDLSDRFGKRIPSQLKKQAAGTQIIKMRGFLEDSNNHREVNNEEYLPLELSRQSTLFDAIEKDPLTEEQRLSVIKDEDANLVVASAGSGKTSVIVAKAAWLLQKELRQPQELLLLAYASDARQEMTERLSERLKDSSSSSISVHTFHSLGLSIIRETLGKKVSLSKLATDEKGALANFVKDAIRSNLHSKQYRQKMTRWFTEFFAPYKSEFDFENYGQYWAYVKKNNIRSLQSIGDIRSLKAEKVKSFEECEIANFLYLNNINYIYEAPYKYDTSSKLHSQYQPDFYLPDYDIYIEHLGLKGFARTAPFVDRKKYLHSLFWKRKLHKEKETTLILTYSCEKSQGVLLSRLEEKLTEKGVVFEEMDGDEVFKILKEKGQIDPFTKLVTTFLGHYKGSHLNEGKLRQQNDTLEGQMKERNAAFIDVFLPVFASYQENLESKNEIDFHDMISQASGLIEEGKYKTPFRYIMVDEFQDISVGRSKLVSALQSSNDDTQLFCVGDDWQAIFRFAGSDINVMKEFGAYFGKFERTDLSLTFRSEEKITNQATNFIMQNEAQIPKSVSAIRKSQNPSVFISFKKQSNKEENFIDAQDHLSEIMGHIASEASENNKPEVLVLGRYNLDTYNRAFSIDYKTILAGMQKRFPDQEITFKTVHRSKGLEADYVIILEVVNDFLGFPNEQADDHILDLVLAKSEAFPNSEERRLFYVALTRAKKKVFVSTTSGMSSEFVDEVIQSPFDCEIWGRKSALLPSCSKCVEGKLLLKTSEFGRFWGCNNHPYCEFRSSACPHCKEGYPKIRTDKRLICDVCEQIVIACSRPDCGGYLQQEKGPHGLFWGCSNYRATGCNYRLKNIDRPQESPPVSKYKPRPKADKGHSAPNNDNYSASSKKIEELRKTHPNAYKPWSSQDDNQLREFVEMKKSDLEISSIMGRQPSAIRSRKDKLAL